MNKTINIIDGVLILFLAALVLGGLQHFLGQDPEVAVNAFIYSASGLIAIFFITGKKVK